MTMVVRMIDQGPVAPASKRVLQSACKSRGTLLAIPKKPLLVDRVSVLGELQFHPYL
jgi:hypothetical protein